jgi:hypothetical protein
MKSNKIPRNFHGMFIEALTDTSGGKRGDVFYILKDERGEYVGTNERTQKKYIFFASHLRNPEYIKILRYC